VKAESRLEGGSGGGASVERQGHFPTKALSVADIAEAFNAEVVHLDESLAEQAAFGRRWNAAQVSVNVPIKNQHVGRPYEPRRVTSQAAAIAATRAGEMRQKVLQIIQVQGPVCDDEIAFELGCDSNSIRPRRLELLRLGAIREAGRRRTRSGRSALGWKVAI
jgi:hypothetical protein